MPTTKHAEVESRLGRPLEFYLWQRYVRDGLTISALADELGIGAGTLWRWLRDFNIPTRQQTWTLGGRPK